MSKKKLTDQQKFIKAVMKQTENYQFRPIAEWYNPVDRGIEHGVEFFKELNDRYDRKQQAIKDRYQQLEDDFTAVMNAEEYVQWQHNKSRTATKEPNLYRKPLSFEEISDMHGKLKPVLDSKTREVIGYVRGGI